MTNHQTLKLRRLGHTDWDLSLVTHDPPLLSSSAPPTAPGAGRLPLEWEPMADSSDGVHRSQIPAAPAARPSLFAVSRTGVLLMLVVHVLEGSSMAVTPPIARVEPADGVSVPSRPTDPDDLFYPGHPTWAPPTVFTSYANGRPVFTLDGVTLENGALTVDLTVP